MQSHSMSHIRVDVQRVPGVRDRQFYKHGIERGRPTLGVRWRVNYVGYAPLLSTEIINLEVGVWRLKEAMIPKKLQEH